jgi:hypothetical protein
MKNAKSFVVATAIGALCSSSLVSPALAQAPPCKGLIPIFGGCADQRLVARSESRSAKLSTAQTSYIGSPFGDVGEAPIPHQRVYRRDNIVDGLPTTTTVTTTTTAIPNPYSLTVTTFKRSK